MGRKHSVLYVISCPLAGRLTRALVGVAPRRGQCDDPRYKADTHFITIVLGYHHHAASCSTSYCLARTSNADTVPKHVLPHHPRKRTAARIWRFHSASTTAAARSLSHLSNVAGRQSMPVAFHLVNLDEIDSHAPSARCGYHSRDII